MLTWHGNNLQRRHVLLDRDGVINRRVPSGYVTSWDQFHFLPRVLDGLRFLAEHGYIALVISNQACVGKGLLSSNDLETITRRFLLEVALTGGNIGHVYYCKHKEEDRCGCRKPLPGLLLRARVEHHFEPEETFFIGDSKSDMAAAEAAGCPSVLIRRDAFLERHIPGASRPIITSNLYEAAELVVALQRASSTNLALTSAASGSHGLHKGRT